MAVLTEDELWFLVYNINFRKLAVYFTFLKETSPNVKSSIVNIYSPPQNFWMLSISEPDFLLLNSNLWLTDI